MLKPRDPTKQAFFRVRYTECTGGRHNWRKVKSAKIYFPNLNGIRFIAALLVIVQHIEQIKNLLGFDNNLQNKTILMIGGLGVVLFFVLSGFLITYLLLTEEAQTATISIKDFYLRRILRIWPLYYLVIGLSFFLYPHIPFLDMADWSAAAPENFWLKFAIFFFFLPNIALIWFTPFPFASQTWSIGVEEQFYLIWPILIKKAKDRELLLWAIILGYTLLRGWVEALKYIDGANQNWNYVYLVLFSFKIQCMAIGGLFALILFKQARIVQFLFTRPVQILTFVLTGGLILLGIEVPFFQNEFFAFLFGILLINLAANKKSILNLEHPILHDMGKISYGLYMYHPLAIVVSVRSLSLLGITNWVLQYAYTVLLTIIIAALSYQFFEKPFIKMKGRFSRIVTGERPKPRAGVK